MFGGWDFVTLEVIRLFTYLNKNPIYNHALSHGPLQLLPKRLIVASSWLLSAEPKVLNPRSIEPQALANTLDPQSLHPKPKTSKHPNPKPLSAQTLNLNLQPKPAKAKLMKDQGVPEEEIVRQPPDWSAGDWGLGLGV